MRYLIKIALLFALSVSSLFANTHIDEYKVDLYYANGILIQNSKINAEIKWKIKAKNLIANGPEQSKHIKSYKIAYNQSNGAISDLFESFLQKAEAEPAYKVTWETFKLFVATKLKYADDLLSFAEQANNSVEAFGLSVQVQAYKDSIKNGHGVIVISHSQGNLFTNKAYTKLDDWMKTYFHNMGVATPASEVASGGPYVTFDNDPIHYILGSLDDNLYNPNRYYSHTNALGERVEALTGAFHSFDYYLGGTASINDVDVSTSSAAQKIQSFIVEKINAHNEALSQWQTDQELNKNTKDYRITVKHRFDQSITTMDGVEVFPFAPSKKLYYVQGEFSEDISGYVKASCGGTEILDEWTGKKDNEFYLINNSEREIIISNGLSAVPTLFGELRGTSDPGVIQIKLTITDSFLVPLKTIVFTDTIGFTYEAPYLAQSGKDFRYHAYGDSRSWKEIQKSMSGHLYPFWWMNANPRAYSVSTIGDILVSLIPKIEAEVLAAGYYFPE